MNTTLTKTRKRMTGGERRDQIVRVAMELFARDGFKGATTREIARKAGISEAVIFKHFSRKEDLYDAIIDSRCSDTGGRSTLVAALEGRKGVEVFGALASHLINENELYPAFLRLLTYSALERHGLSEKFIKTKGLELIEFLEGHIRSLIKEGVFRDDIDAALAARAFMGMVHHYSLSQELYGLKRYFKRPSHEVVDAFVAIFFEGMKRR
jgi:AcrR family transcriptional regulator